MWRGGIAVVAATLVVACGTAALSPALLQNDGGQLLVLAAMAALLLLTFTAAVTAQLVQASAARVRAAEVLRLSDLRRWKVAVEDEREMPAAKVENEADKVKEDKSVTDEKVRVSKWKEFLQSEAQTQVRRAAAVGKTPLNLKENIFFL